MVGGCKKLMRILKIPGNIYIFLRGMEKRWVIVLMFPSKYPGLTGGNFTLVGEDDEIS